MSSVSSEGKDLDGEEAVLWCTSQATEGTHFMWLINGRDTHNKQGA